MGRRADEWRVVAESELAKARKYGKDFMRLPLTRGKAALLSLADADRVIAVGPWHASPRSSGRFVAQRTVVDRSKVMGRRFEALTVFLGARQIDSHRSEGLDYRRTNLFVQPRLPEDEQDA
jgi:hypothetical protein